MIIGHQKGRDTKERVRRNYGMPKPEGYRKALRLMRLAERFGLPLVTLIDTQGAYPGVGAEERGQSEAIARNLFEMSVLRIPIVTVVTGEGGSGGALGIGVCDRLLMLQYSTYSVISPEGCASILWKSQDKKEVAAEALNLTADRLIKLGLVDEVIEEPLGGAHRDAAAVAASLKAALIRHLDELDAIPRDELRAARAREDRRLRRVCRKRRLTAPWHACRARDRRASAAHWLARAPARAAARAARGCTLCVAFSGGADSTALLAALAQLQRAGRSPCARVHVDHGLQPHPRAGARTAGASRARSACRCRCVASQVPRRARRVAGSGGARRRATRLSPPRSRPARRCSRPTTRTISSRRCCCSCCAVRASPGLAAMPAVAPFAGGRAGAAAADAIAREQLRAWLRGAGIAWVEDESNADERLDRNYLRAQVLPRLRARWPARAGDRGAHRAPRGRGAAAARGARRRRRRAGARSARRCR